jgi:hypothetical protein
MCDPRLDDVVLRRHDDGVPSVFCDPCIAEYVEMFNAAGHRTIASCCGHSFRPGRISLANGTEVYLVPLADADAVEAVFPLDIWGH